MKQLFVIVISIFVLAAFVMTGNFRVKRASYSIAKFYEKFAPVKEYALCDIDPLRYIQKWDKGITCICDRDHYNEEMAYFLEHIDEKIERPFYARKHTAVSRMRIGERDYVIKYAWLPGRITNLLQANRGVTTWNMVHWGEQTGVPMVKPIALIQKRSWSLSETYFLTECGVQDGYASLVEKGTPILPAMHKAIRSLKKAAAIHPDLRPRNMVEEGSGRFVYIDLDAFHYYPAHSFIYKKRLLFEKGRFGRDAEEALNMREGIMVQSEDM